MPTFYINADTGDDVGGDGSEGNPWETLEHAINNSAASDTIVCQDATAVYTPPNGVNLENRTIEGESNDASGAVFDFAGNGYVWPYESATIRKITFYRLENNRREGGFLAAIANNVTLTVENCVIRDCKFGGNAWVGGFVCLRAQDNGGNTHGTNTLNTGVTMTVTGCLFDGIAKQTSSSTSGCITNSSNASCTLNFTGNTVYLTASGGDELLHVLFFNAGTETIKNNIFKNDGDSVSLVDGTVETYDYNCANGSFSSIPSGTGNITSDPLFVDPANDNFNLRPDSPCISTGTLL